MQILESETLSELFLPKHVLDQRFFLPLQFANFLFDAVFDEQAVSDDLIDLTNAVSAVDCLVFHRRIPPGIEQNHVAGRCQVKTETARFERNEKDGRSLSRLKLPHQFAAIFGLSRQIK